MYCLVLVAIHTSQPSSTQALRLLSSCSASVQPAGRAVDIFISGVTVTPAAPAANMHGITHLSEGGVGIAGLKRDKPVCIDCGCLFDCVFMCPSRCM